MLVLFKVTTNYRIFKIPASGTDFQNTGLCQISSKIPARPVKYQPSGNPTLARPIAIPFLKSKASLNTDWEK